MNLLNTISSGRLKNIVSKVLEGNRIDCDDTLYLYQNASVGLLGVLASSVAERYNGKQVFFNRNIHIEPTNICINKCKFCSYSRKEGDVDSWAYSSAEILEKIAKKAEDITEVHIVGGIHPDRDLYYFCNLFRSIKQNFPWISIKAFTAPEIDFLAKKEHLSIDETLEQLIDSGLNSVPGGGAEIFSPEIRTQICPEKITANEWLSIHKQLHKHDIKTNATMLYGHIENDHHRIDHLHRLRMLQDETGGFNAFIPLKYRNKNNELSYLSELSIIEDLKLYAISRIFLDNITHIKCYWVSMGIEFAQLSLAFGVDDLDGTINDSTKIYSMAGVKNSSDSLSTKQLCNIIQKANKIAVERDSLYHMISVY